MAMTSTPVHVVEALKLPATIPEGFELDPTEEKFDPAIHLQIEPPSVVFTADFERTTFPLPPEHADGKFGLGYCAPFRLLSDEGVRVLRGIIDKNECHAKRNVRIPKCLRGLGYRSQFVRDLTYCPQVTDFLASIAGKPLAPHGLPMNILQTNFGRKVAPNSGDEAVIDQWHFDSVDYVSIVILSDQSKSVGGDVQVLHKKGVRGDAAFAARGIQPEDMHLVETVRHPAPGYCVFMCGSQIMHRISPVLAAEVPRISCVTSYMSRNVFDEDNTRFHTYNKMTKDPEHVVKVEYARHQAWRVGGMMDFLQQRLPWGTDPNQIAEVLRKAAGTLEKCARLITEEEDDDLPFIDHEKVQKRLDSQSLVLKSKL